MRRYAASEEELEYADHPHLLGNVIPEIRAAVAAHRTYDPPATLSEDPPVWMTEHLPPHRLTDEVLDRIKEHETSVRAKLADIRTALAEL
jgi:hypothetical protein